MNIFPESVQSRIYEERGLVCDVEVGCEQTEEDSIDIQLEGLPVQSQFFHEISSEQDVVNALPPFLRDDVLTLQQRHDLGIALTHNRTTDAVRTLCSAFSAIRGSLTLINIPMPTGTIVINKSVKIVLTTGTLIADDSPRKCIVDQANTIGIVKGVTKLTTAVKVIERATFPLARYENIFEVAT